MILGLYWGYHGVILGLSCGYHGLYWGYIRGIIRVILGLDIGVMFDFFGFRGLGVWSVYAFGIETPACTRTHLEPVLRGRVQDV